MLYNFAKNRILLHAMTLGAPDGEWGPGIGIVEIDENGWRTKYPWKL
jgi:hypothetical protein